MVNKVIIVVPPLYYLPHSGSEEYFLNNQYWGAELHAYLFQSRQTECLEISFLRCQFFEMVQNQVNLA